MNTRRFFMALVVLTMVASVPAFAQSCEQGGEVICGPICGAYYDIIYDGAFNQTSCGAWQFSNLASRATSGNLCGSSSAPLGQFSGPSNDWSAINQTTYGRNEGSGYFSFQYEYEITDPLNNPDTHLEVWIYQYNAQWYYVDAPAGGAQYCQSRSINLGYHPEWKNQPIHVYIWGKVPGSNSKIVVDNVVMFQH